MSCKLQLPLRKDHTPGRPESRAADLQKAYMRLQKKGGEQNGEEKEDRSGTFYCDGLIFHARFCSFYRSASRPRLCG